MKFVLGLGIGIVIGMITLASIQNPSHVANKARGVVDKAEEEAEEFRYESCRDEFLAETNCFQKHPAAKCVEMIDKKCQPESVSTKK